MIRVELLLPATGRLMPFSQTRVVRPAFKRWSSTRSKSGRFADGCA